jgi:hypothetical protein
MVWRKGGASDVLIAAGLLESSIFPLARLFIFLKTFLEIPGLIFASLIN